MHCIQQHFLTRDKVPDTGDGPGSYSIELCKVSYNVVFLDISPGCIATASNSFLVENIEVDPSVLEDLYDQKVKRVKEFMYKKNHDYGEAWEEITISSTADQSLAKIYRIKTIKENKREFANF